MDFVLNIISQPRKRFRKPKVSEETSGNQEEKEKTPMKLKTKAVEEEIKRATKIVQKKAKVSMSSDNNRKQEPRTPITKKRKLTETTEKLPNKVQIMDVEYQVQDKQMVANSMEKISHQKEHEIAKEGKGKKKKKKKELVSKKKRDHESSLNCLEKLMSEPVEAKIEGLFSSCKFDELKTLHPFLLQLLVEKMGLETMTEIQTKCFQPILDGHDALVKAQTGSGKTLAYALPIVQRLQAMEPSVTRLTGPVVLVIVPTRELVSQTQEIFDKLLRPFIRIVCGALTGGVKRKAQKASLRRGLNVLVATPQRLLDHVRSTASLNLSRLSWLVIDEADRLLEVGFERDVRRVLDAIRDCREVGSSPVQTLLLSATLTPKVEQMAGLALSDPVRLSSDAKMEGVALPAGLLNFVILPPTKQRLVTLAAFLLLKCRYTAKSGKVIVFMATQDAVDFHYSLFSSTIACASDDLTLPGITTEMELFRLHGKMEHQDRVSVFRKFSSCSVGGVLLTTDVACRGLDLPRVSWVVQYHVPGKPVDYVHRVGRTARAGGKGRALLFLQDEERDYLKVLNGLGVHLDELPMHAVLQAALVHVNNTTGPGKKRKHHRILRTHNEACLHLQRELEGFVNADDAECKALAEQAFLSYLRFYASFSGPMRDIFRFKGLHLGHVARSFALRETPRDIARRVTGKSPGHRKQSGSEGEFQDVDLSEMEFVRPPMQDNARRNMLAEFGL